MGRYWVRDPQNVDIFIVLHLFPLYILRSKRQAIPILPPVTPAVFSRPDTAKYTLKPGFHFPKTPIFPLGHINLDLSGYQIITMIISWVSFNPPRTGKMLHYFLEVPSAFQGREITRPFNSNCHSF